MANLIMRVTESETILIPIVSEQEALDRYNANYDNQTYGAISDWIMGIGDDVAQNELMNLVSDSALGVCGHPLYQQSRDELDKRLGQYFRGGALLRVHWLISQHMGVFLASYDAPTIPEPPIDEDDTAIVVLDPPIAPIQTVQTLANDANWLDSIQIPTNPEIERLQAEYDGAIAEFKALPLTAPTGDARHKMVEAHRRLYSAWRSWSDSGYGSGHSGGEGG